MNGPYTAAPGEWIEVAVTGVPDGGTVSVSYADPDQSGFAAWTGVVNNGSVTISVRVPFTPGTYPLHATDLTSQDTTSTTMTVTKPTTTTSSSTTSSTLAKTTTTITTAKSGTLPSTGGPVTVILAVGSALLAAGAAFVAVSRRRTATYETAEHYMSARITAPSSRLAAFSVPQLPKNVRH